MICYIIDDEQHAINTLIKYIEKTPGLQLGGSNTDAIQAVNEIKLKNNIEVVFLDIDMPEISGLDTVKLLPSHIVIIFTTAHPNFAVDAFELRAADFLLKPISLPRFIKAIQKLETPPTPFPDVGKNAIQTLFINPGVRGKVVQVALNDILYVEGLKNYVIIYTSDHNKHITYLTMSEIEAALPQPQFFRIHKSFIVNKNKIQSIEGNRVFLTNKMQLNLGITYKDSFMQLISSLTLKSKRNEKHE
jgi:DNA-binding LytR/AlgR family response regulator